MRVERLISSENSEIRFDVQTGHYNGLLCIVRGHEGYEAAVPNCAITVKLRGTKVETPVNNMQLSVFNTIGDMKHGQFNAGRALAAVKYATAEDPITGNPILDETPNDEVKVSNDVYIAYVPLGSIYPTAKNEMDIVIQNSGENQIVVCGISRSEDFPNVIEYDVINDINFQHLQAHEIFAIRKDVSVNPNFNIRYAGSDFTATFDDLNVATNIFSELEFNNPTVALMYTTADDFPEDVHIKHNAPFDKIDFIVCRVKPMEERFNDVLIESTDRIEKKISKTARVNPAFVAAKRRTGEVKINKL